ncbi:MAG: hypothetical protein IJ816_03000 [Alloprevotella sp.]|nr:hypothetical protein [Alloprevotella sp.]
MKKILFFCFSLLLTASICTACDDESQPPVSTPPSYLTLTAAEGYHADPFVVIVGSTRYDISPSFRFNADNTFSIAIGYSEITPGTSQVSIRAEEQHVRNLLTTGGTFTYDEETGALVLTPITSASADLQQNSLLADDDDVPSEETQTTPASYTFMLVRNILGEYVITGNFGGFARDQFNLSELTSVPSALVLVGGALSY